MTEETHISVCKIEPSRSLVASRVETDIANQHADHFNRDASGDNGLDEEDAGAQKNLLEDGAIFPLPSLPPIGVSLSLDANCF